MILIETSSINPNPVVPPPPPPKYDNPSFFTLIFGRALAGLTCPRPPPPLYQREPISIHAFSNMFILLPTQSNHLFFMTSPGIVIRLFLRRGGLRS